MTEISDSRFNMWRAVFAMAHADGKIDPDETDYMDKYLGRLRLGPEQQEQLRREAANPPDMEEVIENVTQPLDRSELVYFARLLAWSDDEMHDDEDVLLAKLNSNAMDKADIAAARQAAQSDFLKHVAEMEDAEDRGIAAAGELTHLMFTMFDRLGL